MIRFVSRRALWGLVTLALLVSFAFIAVNLLLPYDFAVGLGQRSRNIERIREQLGLDRPLWVQWLDYMWHFVRGDLGESYDGYRVSSFIWGALPTTVMIFAVGGVVAYLLGEWLGRLVAWSRSRVLAAASSTASVLLFSAFPPWLIFLLTYFVGDRLAQLRSWAGLPVTGSVHGGPIAVVLAVGLLVALITGVALRGWARRNQRRALGLLAIPAGLAGFALGLVISGTWTDAVDQMLWPSALTAMLALILIAFGESMLVMRAGVSAEMAEDYVLTARAKALPERLIRDGHVAPNAVLPTLSRLFTSVPYLISGLVIIELSSETYALGSAFFYAIESGNVPVIIGIIAVVGVIGLVLRIALDIVQAIIDPRIIRASGESS